MIAWIVGHILAAGIGISLGLLGGGGSILAVPILVYVMGVEPKSAIVMSLAIVGTVSLLGTIPHWKLGNVNVKKAAIFGSATMLGAYGGAKLATLPFVSGTFQLVLFAILMLVAAGFTIRKSTQKEQSASVEPDDLTMYPRPVCRYCWLWLLTEGLGVGVLTGLVGVGGGFAIVPALVLLGKTPMKEAVGTSLAIISLNSVAGLMGYFGEVAIDWRLTLSLTVAASLGMVAGAYLSRFVQAKHLQKAFGYFLLAMAGFILFQNRAVFSSTGATESGRSPATQTRVVVVRKS
ncbi:sulfite exporter TauE/SafE family protein [Oxynema sp. CENA135]|uniref:sulfite exporter TauE/SafE family protein n=1 Tax=Oxynema sp. CENA135 TaxID=984206 RepID=UPI00190E2EA1|nr:sulfite exporter TauE/SafE family protein [Oxynema sp. CENA135]MBK4732059.1 sulfite exporter TauE/SafE family protein [Oxynema sp. CENA135]